MMTTPDLAGSKRIALTKIVLFSQPYFPIGAVNFGVPYLPPIIGLPLAFVLGVVLAFVLLHVARGIAGLHGAIAKNLLVKSAQY